MKRLATLFIATYAHFTGATGLERLDSFVRTVKTGKADFVQTVTVPAKEGLATRSKTSSGSFEFARPGRFRFHYAKPFEQTIVADGQTLWVYDVDLNQVTARVQAQALGSTAAALITAAQDMAALKADFVLENQPDEDGQEWVQATPRGKEGTVQFLRVGFKAGQLSTLEMLDSFGQRSQVRFSGFQANAALAAARFQFKPPAGADVVRQ